jgi:hypothetical protein
VTTVPGRFRKKYREQLRRSRFMDCDHITPTATAGSVMSIPDVIRAKATTDSENRMERMAYGDRKKERVDFERGIPVFIMGIDGTWRRDCMMFDVSQSGARLCIEGSFEGLDLKEFFLLLSSTGLAYRRCRMVRVAGEQIGVEFLAREKAKKKSQKRLLTNQAV